MEALHHGGIWFEVWLQKTMHGQADRFLSITKVGDPDLLILYLFPFVILHGERPYWYVYEHGMNDAASQLKQFSLTCETGPGSPSGHAMITASVWYIIVWAYIKYVVLAISRLYIATHFPHQVLLGSAIGLAVGWFFTKSPVKRLRMEHCLFLTLFLSITAAIVYSAMLAMGVDPHWSVQLALKWCQNREWVHLNTSPLNALFRDTGAIVGLGWAVESRFFVDTTYDIHRDGSEVITAVVSFLLVQLCASIPRPISNLYLYYMATFIQNMSISFVSVALVPFVVRTIWNLNQFPKTVVDTHLDQGPRSKRKLTAYF
ncbi:glucose 6 phosphatase 2 [Trichuris trichiura]|uniref:glucose-6-phosphatase n=1 Tax=Trichuris trichiura TaxID=36087 RepID=A0A077Z9S3_TRITR|nr:glucose 6 phosphatase 2 [Trichuris trichiura]